MQARTEFHIRQVSGAGRPADSIKFNAAAVKIRAAAFGVPAPTRWVDKTYLYSRPTNLPDQLFRPVGDVASGVTISYADAHGDAM